MILERELKAIEMELNIKILNYIKKLGKLEIIILNFK